jgi:hypothetical protein
VGIGGLLQTWLLQTLAGPHHPGQRREERKRLGKAPIRIVVVARCGIPAAKALITPALFSQPPPLRREKRENSKAAPRRAAPNPKSKIANPKSF